MITIQNGQVQGRYKIEKATTFILLQMSHLVRSELPDLDDLNSELHEQSLQDHTLLPPVVLAHGLLALLHPGPETGFHRSHISTQRCRRPSISIHLLFIWTQVSSTNHYIYMSPLHVTFTFPLHMQNYTFDVF